MMTLILLTLGFIGLIALVVSFGRIGIQEKLSTFDWVLFAISFLCPLAWVLWLIVGCNKWAEHLAHKKNMARAHSMRAQAQEAMKKMTPAEREALYQDGLKRINEGRKPKSE